MPQIVHSWPLLALVALVAYLLGSIPFGIVMARLFGLGDLRQIGSGNIGATNVLRSGNKLAALLTLIFDAGKGAIAVLLAAALIGGRDVMQVAGLFAFLGHLFPVYLRFKGGKGVATFLGTMLALSFPLGLAACATWLVVAALLRYSSVAGLMSAAFSVVWAVLLHRPDMVGLIFIFTVLVYIRHIPNIVRLKAGTETKIGQKKA
jgi:glycerol-3-phosphate acyltransferase PlsY